MSELAKLIEAAITDDSDITKVLDDVAIAFKNKGFFDDPVEISALVKSFESSLEKLKNVVIAHEISNSFVVEPSKLNMKTLTPIENQSKANESMFDDSNDSFEIPETQVLPPKEDLNDDLDSEGFVVMPDEQTEANDSSQSQRLFNATDYQRLSPIPQELDEFDLELSKLKWEDSTKETDEIRSASVTPELDFAILTKQVGSGDTKIVNCIKINDSSSAKDEDGIEKSSTCQSLSNAECVPAKDQKIEKIVSNEELQEPEVIDEQNGDKEDSDVTTLFKKPSLPVNELAKTSKENDVEMAETQLFMAPTQLFVVHGSTVEPATNQPNNAPTDPSDYLDETQVFFKSTKRNADISNDDIYNVATQVAEVTNIATNNQNRISSPLHEIEDDGKRISSSIREPKVKSGENQGILIMVTEETKVSRRRAPRKRNRLISSEDEEEVDENPVNKSNSNLSNDDGAQKIDIDKLEPNEEKLFFDLKGADYFKLCKEANEEQSKINFSNQFDQRKALRAVLNENSSVTSASVIKEQKKCSVSGRESRTRRRVNTSEQIETDTNSTRRQKGRIPPLTFKVPSNSSKVSSNSTKSDVNVSNISKEEKADDDVPMEMQATQVFVKATSTPKEIRKDVKPQTRRQAKSVTVDSVKTKEMDKRIKNQPATYNISVTYSPKPANVSSDVNENISAKSNENDESTNVETKRSLKRKATSDKTPFSEASTNESSSSSDSSKTRKSRKLSFRVMFTMIDPTPHLSLLKELKCTLADSETYDVLVTDRIYRTSKFMCALASGKPIVSVNWLKQMKKKKSVVDPFEFLLDDPAGEKKYKFSLAKTLKEVGKCGGLFKNHSILVTPSTTPPPEVLKDIICSSGGKYLKTSLVARKNDRIICIFDRNDKKLLPGLKKKYSTMTELSVEDFMQSIFHFKLKA